MSKELITFKKFNDIGLANELADVLKQHNINYIVAEESTLFNPSFYTDETAKDYAVKISADDFIKVAGVLKAQETAYVDAVEKDHYLYDFTNEELNDLISKPDEWSEFDNLLALKILKERGIAITEQDINELTTKRLDDLKKPEDSQTTWIIFGYLFAILGGVLGAFIGWHLFTSKKTLPNGERVFNYKDADRAQGRIIFYLSIFVLIAVFIARIIDTN